MKGFCTECGQPLDMAGKCPEGHFSMGTKETPVDPSSVLIVEPSKPSALQHKTAGGDTGLSLPKASTMRRLLGSGIEYLIYVSGIVLVLVLSPLTGLTLGIIGPLLLLVMVGLRDVNAGALSIGKRIGGMRVVHHATGLPPSNGQAILRNAYYLLLLLIMSLPAVEYIGSFFFVMLIGIDILMILVSPKGRRIGDMLAGTQVITTVQR